MRLLSAFFVLLLILSASLSAREKISLDGVWSFATDPERIGESENWFAFGAKMAKMPLEGYAPEADGTIQVPGIWDHQGYGTDSEKVRHHFVGFGWYKKNVDIPAEWEGNEIFLHLGGISRSARIWVNGQLAGEDLVGQVASFSVDITSLVRFGEANDLTIRVDSHQHWEVDAILGAASLNDYMEIEWGGLWGHVSIEAKPKERIDNLYLMTNITDSTCTATADLISKNQADNLKIEIFDAAGQKVSEKVSAINDDTNEEEANQTVSATVVIENASLWTPDTPYLYTVRLSLLSGLTVIDSIESRYGMRELKADGYRLLLNGKPFYLIGYGDDHIYPYEYSMSTNKEMYKERLTRIKSFGFNHVRNHSTILPREYYEACDEIGVMPTGEFPIGYPHQIPGNELWEANVPKGTPLEPVLDTYRERFAQVVREYRNHPSILTWVMGNELWGGMSINQDFKKIAKTLDPQRFFSDSDGDLLRYFQEDEFQIESYWLSENKIITKPGRDRDTIDLGFALFSEGKTPLKGEKFTAHGFSKPIISHESGNYITFSRPDQLALFDNSEFDGNPSLKGTDQKPICSFKPFWMTEGVARLKELAISDTEIEEWARSSEEMYYLHHKTNIESMRLNPEITGYHWWLIQDYWTTSNGLMDLFFRQKSIAPERVRIFNSPLVLLQNGINLTYNGGEEDQIELSISNYTTEPISGELIYTRMAAGEEKRDRFTVENLQPGEVKLIGTVDEKVPDPDKPTEMTICAELLNESGETIKTNQWRSVIYPSYPSVLPEGKKVYASEDILDWVPDSGMELIPASENLPIDAVYLVSTLEPRLVDALERGAGLVLLDASSQFDGVSINYQQTWWKGGEDETLNHTGTYVYDTSMMREMNTVQWCNKEWYDLLNGATKYYLEKMPSRPNLQIRALPSLVRVQDTAVLFDVTIGQGTLVVSGLNHTGAKDRPENRAVLRAMIHYAATEKPDAVWSRSAIMPEISIPAGTTLTPPEK